MEDHAPRSHEKDLLDNTLFFLEVGGMRFGLSGPVRGDVTLEERGAGKKAEVVAAEPMTVSFGLLPEQAVKAQPFVGSDGRVVDRSGHVVMAIHIEQVSPRLNVLVGLARPASDAGPQPRI